MDDFNYYYSFNVNPSAPKSGEQKSDISTKEEANLDTVNSNHVHNNDWNKSVNDRQTNTFNSRLTASNLK